MIAPATSALFQRLNGLAPRVALVLGSGLGSLVDAVEEFERVANQISAEACRAWAEKFSESAFKQNFTALVNEAWDCWKADPTSVEPKILGNAHG